MLRRQAQQTAPLALPATTLLTRHGTRHCTTHKTTASCRPGDSSRQRNGSCECVCLAHSLPRSGQACCITCPAGLYNDDAGTLASLHVNCTACPTGSFLSHNGTNASQHDSLSDCAACAPGKYSAVINRTLPGDLCPTGRYLFDKATDPSLHDNPDDCRVCPAGSYADVTGTPVCSDCAANTFIIDNAEDEDRHNSIGDCIQCLPGQHSNSRARICVSCEAGTYGVFNSSSNVTTCNKCKAVPSASRWQHELLRLPARLLPASRGATVLPPCIPGRFGYNSTCSACPRGYFSNETAAHDCKRYASWETSESERAGDLSSLYSASTVTSRSDNCKNCAENEFTNATLQTGCRECPAGESTDGKGKTTCTACGAGKFKSAGSTE